MLFFLGLAPGREPLSDLGLDRLDALGAAARQRAARQNLLGGVIELAQQRRLPAVPHVGTDGADVADREDQQQAKPFRRLHQLGEALDGLRVHQVALKRRRRHGEVIAHQPGNGFGLGRAQTEPRAELQRHVGAQYRMVAAAALGDVVQQHREIEHRPRQDLVHHVRRQRVIFLEAARLDLRQQADGADGVLVDSVRVVHVVLGLRHDAPEVRHEAAEHARLVETPERRLRVLARRQHLHEEAVGLWIAAQLVEQADILRDQPQRRGMDIEAVFLGDMEQPQDGNRILLEHVGARRAEPLTVDLEAFELARTQGLPQGRELGLATTAVFQCGDEDAREVAYLLRMQEVVLHEALDAAAAGPVLVAQPARDLALQVERHAVIGAIGQIVDVTAHRRQEALGPLEVPRLAGGEHALGYQLVGLADAIEILGDPEQQVQVAQPALAFLDVGFHDIARIAHALVPLIAFGELGLDEIATVAGQEFLREQPVELVEQVFVAPDIARLQQGGADGLIPLGISNALVDGTRGMADLQAEIPQQVEHELDDLLAARRLLVGP